MIESFCSKNQDGYTCKFVTKKVAQVYWGESTILPVADRKAPTNQIKRFNQFSGEIIFRMFEVENFDLSIIMNAFFLFTMIDNRNK